ncbi:MULTISPECIES: hypothetical protein [Tissierellales]|jgi:predicted anti-sigma-YlaC factor YlaD|uniref:Uncharacterized protein n=1 Tax=Acidilutibacter cellobiosedens TaxID=2507161 RepID=A0A410Q9X6_9FIRM|nr:MULTISPECIES: hypothetical protein [Tissierellales]MBE6081590.1 hypothetical protein [Tissierellaceae bacterium]QAT60777.1 hypothetical protein EQM13_03865 [Acidilutibacter cellobiosedens]SCL87603.1 hypothetical protein PP176A_1339 [Sporanaerobacter sp. PP17-6a]
MKHYDYLEWFFYKEKVFSEEKNREMEEHLYKCEKCMDIFLSLIDEKEVTNSEKMISKNFTENVVNNVRSLKYGVQKKKKKKYRSEFRTMFGYYVAAAAVAIILTFGGFYGELVDMLPQVANFTVERKQSNLPNVIFNLSEKIAGRTSDFIKNFQILK